VKRRALTTPRCIRQRSSIVTWLWLHTGIGYSRARRWARWLP
jgi:hypothetical protein